LIIAETISFKNIAFRNDLFDLAQNRPTIHADRHWLPTPDGTPMSPSAKCSSVAGLQRQRK
jgi:hypothetical protein